MKRVQLKDRRKVDKTVKDFVEEHQVLMETPKPKVPKRVIHCSDGVVEEYSEDEADATKSQPELPVVDPKTLTWFPWMWYQTTWVGIKTLGACDYVGESLANFFGITSSKYQFEINEYNRMKEREAEEKKEEDLEMGGWTEKNRNNLVQQDGEPVQQTENNQRY